jgi:hypothetical protein
VQSLRQDVAQMRRDAAHDAVEHRRAHRRPCSADARRRVEPRGAVNEYGLFHAVEPVKVPTRRPAEASAESWARLTKTTDIELMRRDSRARAAQQAASASTLRGPLVASPLPAGAWNPTARPVTAFASGPCSAIARRFAKASTAQPA